MGVPSVCCIYNSRSDVLSHEDVIHNNVQLDALPPELAVGGHVVWYQEESDQ